MQTYVFNLALVTVAFFVFSICFAEAAAASNQVIDKYLARNPLSNNFEFTDSRPLDSPVLAHVFVNHSMNRTGFDVVTISPDRTLLAADPAVAYYASGYAESYFTWESILAGNWSSQGRVDANTTKFISEMLHFCDTYATKTLGKDESRDQLFANSSLRMMSLLKGMTDGINRAIDESKSTAQKWSLYDMFFLNLQAELFDFIVAANPPPPAPKEEGLTEEQMLVKDYEATMRHLKPLLKGISHGRSFSYQQQEQQDEQEDPDHPHHGQHCSLLIKKTTDDLAISHTTWSGYNTMLRQFKTYNFETTIVMSSYPGYCASTDDWYQTGNGLVISETTLNIYNESLTRQYVKPNLMPEFMRVMTANLFATNGEQWVNYFLRINSGSYCNAYHVLDMKKVSTPANKLMHGVFTYVEQLPGPWSVSADLSEHLNQYTYFASYNLPFFPQVNRMSGNLAMEAKFGRYESYDQCDRARIFRRNQSTIVQAQGVFDTVRYNGALQFHDPLSTISRCKGCVPSTSPQLAPANRADLVPVDANFGNLSKDIVGAYKGFAFGGIDAKMTSFKLMTENNNNKKNSNNRLLNQKTWFQSGPTTSQDTLPAFEWSKMAEKWSPKNSFGHRNRMQPNLWNFATQSLEREYTYSSSFPIDIPSTVKDPMFFLESASISPLVGLTSSAIHFDKYDSASKTFALFGTTGSNSVQSAFGNGPGAAVYKTKVDYSIRNVSHFIAFGPRLAPLDRVGIQNIVLDSKGEFAYLQTSADAGTFSATSVPAVVKLYVPEMKRAFGQNDLPLGDSSNAKGGFSLTGLLDASETHGFFATSAGMYSVCTIVKATLKDMKAVGNVTLPSGQQCVASARLGGSSDALFVPACYSGRCAVYRVDLATLKIKSTLTEGVPSNFGRASVRVTRDGKTAYLLSNNQLLKIKIEDDDLEIESTLATVSSMRPPLTLLEPEDQVSGRDASSDENNKKTFAFTGSFSSHLKTSVIRIELGGKEEEMKFSGILQLNSASPDAGFGASGAFVLPRRGVGKPAQVFFTTCCGQQSSNSSGLVLSVVNVPLPGPAPAPTFSPNTAWPITRWFEAYYNYPKAVPDAASLTKYLRAFFTSNHMTSSQAALLQVDVITVTNNSFQSVVFVDFKLTASSGESPDSSEVKAAIELGNRILSELSRTEIASALHADGFAPIFNNPTTTASPGDQHPAKSKDTGKIVAAVIGGLAGFVLIAAAIWYFKTRNAAPAPGENDELVTNRGGNNSNVSETQYRAVNEAAQV